MEFIEQINKFHFSLSVMKMMDITDKSLQVSRADIMKIMRHSLLHEILTADDCVEIFQSILKGGSDLNADLIMDLCSEYNVSIKNLILDILRQILDQ